ncbi:hypothetical protein [Synechococcus sp. Cu2B8-bc1011]|uniref:hypothetical protein n=1 Tax=Synechococcus sp. Cu2B8-bc1011 TaxID=3093725 RepID=UPI0039AF3C71
MSNKDRPLVGCHVQKNGVCWLMNDHGGEVCSFSNANPTAYPTWVVVETRPDTRQWSAGGHAHFAPLRHRSLGNHAEVRRVEALPA